LSIGKLFDRVELYSTDEHGDPIGPVRKDARCHGCGTSKWNCAGKPCCDDCWHPEVQPVRETQNYAPRSGGVAVDVNLEAAQEWAQAWQGLTPRQREAWRMRNNPRPEEMVRHECHHTVTLSDVERYLDAGWLRVRPEDGGAKWIMTKDIVDVRTFEEMGAVLDCSADEARRLERAAARALANRRKPR
jgi:hypothetical protein